MIKRLFVILLLSAITGCGIKDTVTDFIGKGKDNAEPPAPLVDFQPSLNVIRIWSESTGDGTDEQYLKMTPVIAQQRVYVASADGKITALDATNGDRIWSRKLKVNITSGLGYGENTVLVGTGEGDVIAFDSGSGNEQWRTKVSSEILSPPQKSDNVVVVRTLDGKVFGLSGDNGTQLWIYDRTVPALSLRGTSTPVISGSIVVAGFDAGRLAGLELHSGKLIWETAIADPRGRSELERMVDIDSEPLIVEGVIYVATFQGQLAAIHLDTGRLLWSREISSYAGFSADGSYIYITDDNSHISAIDRFSGTTIWKQEKLHARAVTAPASIGNYIVVGDLEGYLHWMRKSDGRFVQRNQLSDERIIAPPIPAGKILYAFCTDGILAAYTFR